MVEMKVAFDEDRGRAMVDTKVWAALALTGEQRMGVHDALEMETLAREAGPTPTGAGW
jgi:coenzyme F420-dependent glucose-6-phosphate dehydrogenase